MARAAEHLNAEQMLERYEEDYLECRGLLHAWRRVGFFSDGGYISQLTVCERCHTRKITTMTRNGMFVSSRYEHPEGYRLSGSYVSRTDVRRETLRRYAGQVFNSADALIRAQETGQTIIERRAARRA